MDKSTILGKNYTYNSSNSTRLQLMRFFRLPCHFSESHSHPCDYLYKLQSFLTMPYEFFDSKLMYTDSPDMHESVVVTIVIYESEVFCNSQESNGDASEAKVRQHPAITSSAIYRALEDPLLPFEHKILRPKPTTIGQLITRAESGTAISTRVESTYDLRPRDSSDPRDSTEQERKEERWPRRP